MDSNDGVSINYTKMSSIKKFFQDERDRQNRIREMRKAKVHPIAPVYVVDRAKLEKAYNNIMQWNMDYPEDLVNYYESLDQEEYEYIVQKSKDFPEDVKLTLWGPPIFKVGTHSKLKVVDLTNKMYTDQKMNEQQEFDTLVKTEVAKHCIPNRPADELDTTLADLQTRLKTEEEQLEKLMKAPTKKYVAPSMRQQVILSDPDVQNMQKQIEKIKNEISIYEKYIVDANNGWSRLKHLELRDQVIREMLAV